MPQDDLKLNEKVPNKAEADVVGKPTSKITEGSEEFKKLVKNDNADIVFKNEEGDDSDRMMTKNLAAAADKLAGLVKSEWSGVKLRITEAWDNLDEHGGNSTHYEARGADLTTSDQDRAKYGRLGRLAVNAGFNWVFYENAEHIHGSVVKDSLARRAMKKVAAKKKKPAPAKRAAKAATKPPAKKAGKSAKAKPAKKRR